MSDTDGRRSTKAGQDKRRAIERARDRLLYVWFYFVRRGPRALRRRLNVLRQRRQALNEAHVESGFLVAVHIGGGIGDQIVIARFLRDVTAELPEMRFDVFSNDLATTEWAFGKNPAFRRAYIDSLFRQAEANYEFSLEISDAIVPISDQARPGEGQRGFAVILERCTQYNDTNKGLFDLGVYSRTLQAIRLVCDSATRHTALHHIAGIDYGGDRMQLDQDTTLLQTHDLANRTYVTVHTGFGADQITRGRQSTKCYPHFDAVIDLMRAARPELSFVQLGASNSEALKQANIRFLGGTDMPQVAALLAGAALHLDNESGLVHIGRCVGTRSCVVFGPTNPDFFGYDANLAIRPPVCGGCWWVTRDWMNTCPRGFDRPICTDRISPEAVAASALQMLVEREADKNVNDVPKTIG
jgi:ADP-heptose:LPS heptosyltransferase